MNICIRADGGSAIGMGHIMRTLVLAQKLKKYHNVFYVCRVDSPLTSKYYSGIKLIKNNNFNVITIDEDKLKQKIVDIEADCIITDSYDVDEEYFDILRLNFPISGCIYDTDYKKINNFNVDFFINPDLYAEEKPVRTKNCNKVLLGSRYIMLRKEFFDSKISNIYTVSPVIKNIIITLGGGNSSLYINKILKSVKNLNQFNFYIVLGSGFNNKKDLIHEYSQYENIHVKYDVTNMSDLMIKCDLAVTSCSTTLYELMYLGIPIIGLVTADNQVIMANYLRRLNIIEICNVDSIKEQILKSTFDSRLDMHNKFKQVIDGKGVNRIINNIINIYENKKMEDLV